MTEKKCPYCEFDDYDVIDKNDFGVILPEANPLSKGHSIIIPIRHVSSFFEVTDKERNDGDVFGEASEHLHIHIIPRYKGQQLKLDKRWGIVQD